VRSTACRAHACESVPCAVVCPLRRWPRTPATGSQWQHMFSFLWATFETWFRGFLLGFGVMVCKEVMFRSAEGDVPVLRELEQEGDKDQDTQPPRTARVVPLPDFSHMFARAKVAGLGVGCLVVGASLLLPASLRQKMLAA
jgi:hypothetical protein